MIRDRMTKFGNLKMEKFILRMNPFFEISMNDNSFEISNSEYTFNNGTYQFTELLQVDFFNKKLDWFSTIFGNIIGFFLGGQTGYEIADAKLVIHFKTGRNMAVMLIDCDLIVAEKVTIELKKRILS